MSAPIGDAPEHLAEPVAAVWRELQLLLPQGAATSSDRLAFELLARALHASRNGTSTAAELAQLRTMLGDFGLTPAARRQLELRRLLGA